MQGADDVRGAEAATPTGRFEQKRRTRAAIVAAATRLMSEGKAATVTAIAEVARVSRRTVYLHFPNQEQLLLDATIGALTQQAVDEAISAADRGETAAQRSIAMAGELSQQASAMLPMGRQLIKLTVDAPAGPGVPRRGLRRLGWIETALEPLRPLLTPAAYQRLAAALAVVAGWEALVVLEDVCALDPDGSRDRVGWMVRSLVQAALSDGREEPVE